MLQLAGQRLAVLHQPGKASSFTHGIS